MTPAGQQAREVRVKVYILRHGETDYNARHLFQGQTYTHLNEQGFEQARAAKKTIKEMGLSFDRVYSSPIPRALETVETVTGLPEGEILLDDRLREMDFGPLDGTPFVKDAPLAGCLFTRPDLYVPPEGAESFDQLLQRLRSFFEDLAKTGDHSVLVGCHGCAMRCMLVLFGYLELPEIWHQGIGNCTIIEAEENRDGSGNFHVVKLHETQDPFGVFR